MTKNICKLFIGLAVLVVLIVPAANAAGKGQGNGDNYGVNCVVIGTDETGTYTNLDCTMTAESQSAPNNVGLVLVNSAPNSCINIGVRPPTPMDCTYTLYGWYFNVIDGLWHTRTNPVTVLTGVTGQAELVRGNKILTSQSFTT